MKILSAALCVLAATSLPVCAQLDPLPASSVDDGIVVQAPADQPGWAGSALHQYRLASDNVLSAPSNGFVDSHGVTWTSNGPDRSEAISGATYRVIFLGGSGSWLKNIGYSYSGGAAAADSFTLGSLSDFIAPARLRFGDVVDISLIPGDASTFDFWLNTNRGTYTLFNPANSTGGMANIYWTQSPLLVPTFLPALSASAEVQTWIGSVIEPAAPGDDAEHVFRFAFQQYFPSGGPIDPPTAIPEPSTFGAAAAVVLGVALLVRRRR